MPAACRTALRARQRMRRIPAAGAAAAMRRPRSSSYAIPSRVRPSCSRRRARQSGAARAAAAGWAVPRRPASAARPEALRPRHPTPPLRGYARRAAREQRCRARVAPLRQEPGSRARLAAATVTRRGHGGRRRALCRVDPPHRIRKQSADRRNWRDRRASAKLARELAPRKHPSANPGRCFEMVSNGPLVIAYDPALSYLSLPSFGSAGRN